RDVKRDVRFVQRLVECREQAAALRGVVLEVREHAGRPGAPRLEYQIRGKPVCIAVDKIARRVAQAEQAARVRGRQLQALERARGRDAEAEMQDRHPLLYRADGVAAGAYQNQIFRIYHDDRLPCTSAARTAECAALLWTFWTNSITLY